MIKPQIISRVLRIGVLLILVMAIIIAAILFRDQFNLYAIRAWLAQFGVWAPLLFIGLYALATVLFLPGSVLTLTGGLLFGAYWGTLYNLTGAVVGATGAFLIARYVASDWVAQRAGGRLGQLVDGINEEGWRFVAVVRLIPLFPFNLLNYALGLTKIGILPYVIASAVFMLPGVFAYTYVGSLGESFIHGGGQETVTRVFIAFGLLVLVACIPWVVKRLRRKD